MMELDTKLLLNFQKKMFKIKPWEFEPVFKDFTMFTELANTFLNLTIPTMGACLGIQI